MQESTLGASSPTYKDVREKKRQAFLAAARAERTGKDDDRQKAEAAQIRYDAILSLYERNGKPSHKFYESNRAISNRTADEQPLGQLSSAGHGRIRDVVNGVVVFEAWYRHGELHGEHGAALIRRDPASGVVIEEKWMRRGKLDRATAPAWIQRDGQTGVVTSESWWREGQRKNARCDYARMIEYIADEICLQAEKRYQEMPIAPLRNFRLGAARWLKDQAARLRRKATL